MTDRENRGTGATPRWFEEYFRDRDKNASVLHAMVDGQPRHAYLSLTTRDDQEDEGEGGDFSVLATTMPT